MKWVRGSSPLARGTLSPIVLFCGVIRLIPARAGNTTNMPRYSSFSAAHPRSRGEHIPVAAQVVYKRGSSPLARGTPTSSEDVSRVARLIPARAGNTTLSSLFFSASSAHPRSRGEHCSRVRARTSFFGSSPLARGTPLWPPSSSSRCRLIPARAGNTNYGLRE